MGWFFDELKETSKTDYCTFFPDIILGFSFYRVCKLHDYAYRKRPIPGVGRITSRWQADLFAWQGAWKVINDDSVSFIHWILGHIIAFIFLLGIRLGAWRAWHKRRN